MNEETKFRPHSVPLLGMAWMFLPVLWVGVACSMAEPPSAVSVEREPFWVWAAGDAHIQADLSNGYRSLAASTRQVREASAAPDWDVWVNPGDFVGKLHCPGESEGREVLRQFRDLPRNRMYAVAGNHDAGTRDARWFRRYIDPVGLNAYTSEREPASRPFPVEGSWDHYAFRAGNVVFLMISDHNFGPSPFGRRCGTGAPAGRYSRETFDWWVDQVEAHRQQIVVTVAHHALLRTTIYTDYGEGSEHAHDRGDRGSWADDRGASILYAIGNRTIDGRNADREQVGERDYGFKHYLERHPGAVDLWLSGHTHFGLEPGAEHAGRGLIERVHGTWFLNTGALTRHHAAPEIPFSRMIGFRPGSSEVRVRTFMHAAGSDERKAGFSSKGSRRLSIDTPFRPDTGTESPR